MEPLRWNSKLAELLASSAGADADAIAGADAIIAGSGLGVRDLDAEWKHATPTPKLSKLPFVQSFHRGGNREIAALASRQSWMRIGQIGDGVPLHANHVYFGPADKLVCIRKSTSYADWIFERVYGQQERSMPILI
jgi:hypothetical protein